MAHSSGQPMECEAVEGRLLDLVYGELDATETQSMRAHVETCEECGRALARLEGGRAVARKMEVIEPRAGLLDAVRAAARTRAVEVERESAPSPRVAAVDEAPRTSDRERAHEPERTWWGELLGWLGSMAMGPQVAMATLLVLMVGIGLWSIPSLRGRGVPSGGVVLAPDTAGEAGPSTGGLEPAEPLAFDFDPRTRRLAPIGDEEERVVDEPAAAATARPAPAADRRVAVEPRAGQPREGEEQAQARAEEPAPRPDQAPADEGEALALAGVEAELAPGEAYGPDVVEPTAPASSRTATSAAASVERRAPIAVAPQPSSAPPPSSAPRASSSYRYGGGDDVARPEADTGTLVASALHQQARAAAARGAHADCVRQYETLAARHPTYSESGRALVELAECQRRLGQLSAAARTLERAQQHAPVRADATRELARVRMAERAAAVPVEEPAAAPSTTSSD